MANRVFISFRFDDGKSYKDELVRRFEKDSEVINCSEDKDRSEYTDETIKKYLYGKLSNTSVTIVILTPKAIKHQKDYFGRYDDWMYDEIRYSLEDRDYNKSFNKPRINGVELIGDKNSSEIHVQHEMDEITNQEIDNIIYA